MANVSGKIFAALELRDFTVLLLKNELAVIALDAPAQRLTTLAGSRAAGGRCGLSGRLSASRAGRRLIAAGAACRILRLCC